MSKELFLEIGTEEVPAGFIPAASAQLKALCERRFGETRLEFAAVHTYATPRRLILHVEGLAETQADLNESVLGPPCAVAFDGEGKPTKAAVGFARNQNVAVEELSVEKTPKGDYLCAVKNEAGEATPEVLQRLLPEMITALQFPKSMRWGSGTLRFARPIHWILSVYNEEVVLFEFDGIKSGNLSRGHRFMSPGSFTVHSSKSYKASARERFVMFDPAERKREIEKQIEKIEQQRGGKVIPDPRLLEEVSYLVEYPTALCGTFEDEFLKLPRQVLITAMREHQRYFSMEDKEGNLMPHFVTVSNTRPKDTSAIISGNERVLRARLRDALFFFTTDTREPLDAFVKNLQGVTFQEKLGTLYEKMERVKVLSLWLADKLSPGQREDAGRTAYLCKADLCTEMVGEFPSLQGEMGREYARLSGESSTVALAIEEHYRPRFSGDNVPSTEAGAIVSVADKMDTIAGCFGIGLIPSGSEDPYALRRQTLAILTILLEKDYPLPVTEIIMQAQNLLEKKVSHDTRKSREAMIDYFKGRLSGLLTARGHRYDTVEAVLEAGFDDVPDARARVEALSGFRSEPLFEPFTVVCKRAMNIIKGSASTQVDHGRLNELVEKELHAATNGAAKEIPGLVEAKKYAEALRVIASLRDPIDAFFEGVMVMDKDEAIKKNRLALLARVAVLVSPIADFSKIVLE
jgi:glycyl-tRNA synthetase beta chain